MDAWTVLEEEEVSEEWCLVMPEPAFPVRGPDVLGVPDRFFRPVVEVVAEARSDLGLELHRQDEMAVGYDKKIPLLLRAVVTGKLEGRARADVGAGQASVDKHIREEHFEGAHLRPAGNSAAGT